MSACLILSLRFSQTLHIYLHIFTVIEYKMLSSNNLRSCALHLKSSGDFSSCGFDSHPGHQFACLKSKIVSEIPSGTIACRLATLRDSENLSEWPSPLIEAARFPWLKRSQPNPVGFQTTAPSLEAASPGNHCR